jgi:hypothetical protein
VRSKHDASLIGRFLRAGFLLERPAALNPAALAATNGRTARRRLTLRLAAPKLDPAKCRWDSDRPGRRGVASKIAKRLGLGAVLGLAMGGLALAQSVAQFDGHYVGELTLVRVIAGDCTHPPLGAAYPLTVLGGEVRFKYVPRFDTTLRGRVDSNGTFKATRILKRGLVSMTGRIQNYAVTATIVSPSCVYNFQTK